MPPLPPLPEGFSLMQEAPSLPPIPEGFQLVGEAPSLPQSSMGDNLLRAGVGQGLMFGTGDEAEAWLRSKISGRPYEEELGLARGKVERFRKEEPILSTAAEIAGGFALPVGGLAGGGAKAAALLAKGGMAGRLAAKPVRALSNAMTLAKADTIVDTARKGAVTGGAFGAAAGYGAGEGGVGERLQSAGQAGLIAGGMGGVLGPAARGIGAGLGAVGRHITSSPDAIAYRRGAQAFEDARLDPEDLLADIAPINTRARTKTTPEQNEAVISAKLSGTSAKQIAKDTGLTPFVIQRIWRDFQKTRARAPLNIMERASLAGDQGPGAARPLSELGRASANLPGKGQSIAFERSLQKQIGQRGRVEQLVDDTFGAEDYAPRIDAIEEALTKKAGDAYDQLYANSPVIVDDDLAKIIVTPVARPFWEKARALAAAEGRFIPTYEEIAAGFHKSPTKALGFLSKKSPQAPVSAPTMALPVRAIDYFQRALRLEAKGAFQSGRGAEGATAAAIRKRLLDVVDPRIAGYRSTRQAYAEGKLAEEALTAGRGFVMRAGQRADDVLKSFEKMQPEQQELFRIGMGQAMKDMMANKQATHDLTASLRTPAAQEAYRRVLGSDKASRFVRGILEEAEVTRSSRFLTEGSRTTPLAEAQKKLLEEEQFVSDVISLKPMGLLSGVAKRMARALAERNNEKLADILTTTDEGAQLRALRAIKAALEKERGRIGGLERAGVRGIRTIGMQTGREQTDPRWR